MTDTTISDAEAYPVDDGTGVSDGDENYNSAAWQALLARYKGDGSYVGEDTSGSATLQFNDVDTTSEQVDVGNGYAYITESGHSVQSRPQTTYDTNVPIGVPYVVLLPTEVANLDLGTDTDNDLWLAVDPTAASDPVYIRHGSGLSAPSDPSVKLGTVNTSTGATTRANDLSSDTHNQITADSLLAGESGSASSPVWTFGDDTDTGIFRHSSGTVAFAADGSESLRVGSGGLNLRGGIIGQVGGTSDSTSGAIRLPNGGSGKMTARNNAGDGDIGVIWADSGDSIRIGENASVVRSLVEHQISDGSASDPGLSFTNDTDTGIYRPAGNQIAIAQGGSEGARLNPNGDWVVQNDLLLNGHISLADTNRQSSGSNITLSATDPMVQNIDATSAINVDLPAESNGLTFVIGNRGSSDITLRDDGGATLTTVNANDVAYAISDGTGWLAFSAAGGVT